ncbi:AMP-binding protein (plasmid) [Ralstonia pseudosolanacearum]|uniref:AMP-binding protein n=1 Tax=Ralstonia pseudosolanacearum TaxID=1310165 RepID=UPI0018669936|nr:AMP-binding protein [Ralstonia pseudosolanacearum]QOK94549.1 AMP-binding protein [Ralstonia pseudosolanacearum]
MTSLEAFLRCRDALLAHREDYDTAVRDFAWPALDRFNWALDYFDGMARGNAATALWVLDEQGGETRLSFAQMAERSARVANHLRALGVRRGDRVMLILGNVPALWDVMLACMKLGAVIIPATTLLTADDLRERIAMGEVGHVVAGATDCAKLDGVAGTFTRIAVGADRAPPGWHRLEDAYAASPEFTPDAPTQASDPLLLYFTSGTTSRPKLVMHTHASYPVGHLSTLYWIGLRPGDVHWNISSPGWAKHAWSCFFAPWNAGATVFVYNAARFETRTVLDVLCRAGVTTLCAPPTVWRLLIQEDLAAWKPALRELVGAGERLNPEVIERVRAAWGITIRDGYGQTETTCQIGNSPGQPVKPGAMGRPLPGYRITLRDPDGNPADEGEICIELDPRPMGLMAGYAGNADKTAEAMRGGVYHTSDIAARDADGYLTYVGRADDVFKASDYRVSPFELESVLIEHPAVAEAAVVPSPDPLRLAVPKAFLVLRAGHVAGPDLARDILRFCRARLASYKRVRRIEFAELPKTISGKIRRVELRQREAARPETGRNLQEYWEDDFPAD